MRLAALATAAVLAGAADSTPVVGSGSFNAAPMLAPGRYRDTILPEEYLYYGVRVQAGQKLHVVADSELGAEELSGLDVSFVAVNVASPDRDQISGDIDGRQLFSSDDDDPADFTTPAATTVAAEEDEGGSINWDGPGVYFLSFYAVYTGSDPQPPKAEIPFHFEVSLEGAPETEPAATPIATPTPKATASPAAAPARGGGATPALAAGFGIGGVLVGVFAGLALRRR